LEIDLIGNKLIVYTKNMKTKTYKLCFLIVLVLASILTLRATPAKAATFDLIQPEGDSRVYLKENNAKRHIKDYDTFLSFGFTPSMIRRVSKAEGNSYPTAPQLTRVLNYNGMIYAIIGGQKAYVTSSEALILNGFSWGDLQPFADPTFGMLSEAAPLTAGNVKIVHIPSLGKVYYVENGYRRWIKDWATWQAWQSFTGPFVNSEAAKSMPEAPALSRVLNYNGNIYVIENGTKRYVPSNEALVLNNYSWSELQPFADPTFSQMPTGANMSAPRLVACNNSVYLIAGGARHHVETGDAYQAFGEPYINSNLACSMLPETSSITRLLQGPDGRTYYFGSNQLRYITSPGVFAGYNFSWSNVRAVGADVIAAIPLGLDMASWADTLNGIAIPATTGYVGKEQHLWTTAGDTTDAAHYALNNTAVMGESIRLQNGVAGNGAFGKMDPAVEKYYITMRWNYCDWHESATGETDSFGKPLTKYSWLNDDQAGFNSLKSWHMGKKVLVSNPATGRKIVVAVGESGPAIWVTRERGVVSGLSPEATDYIVGDHYYNGRGAGTGGDNLEYHWLIDQTLPLGPLNW
jgi:hypothetical protein